MAENPTSIRVESYEWPELEDSPLGIRYSRLRAMVYVVEQHFRNPDVLDLRGGETDAYDPYSRHFLAFNEEDGSIIGCARTIHDPPALLPIEKYFPESLDQADLEAMKCAEISRFIARGPSMRSRRTISLLLIQSFLSACLQDGLGHVLFIVEEPFTRWLTSLSIPFHRLGDFRYIPEEAGELAPIAVDIADCDRALRERHRVYAAASSAKSMRIATSTGNNGW